MKIYSKHINLDIILLVGYVVLYLFWINMYPSVQMDEPWYSNTAYNFSIGKGFTNTNVGCRGGDVFLLYTFLLGIFYKLFGCTLLTTRLFSIILGLFTAFFILKISNKKNLSITNKLIVFFVFTVSNIFYIIFRSGRPEGLLVLLAIVVIYFIIELLEKYETRKIIFLAVASALAFNIHPNGILFIANSGIIILFIAIRDRKFKAIIIYSFIVVLVSSVPFLVLMSDSEKYHEFLIQAGDRSGLNPGEGPVGNLKVFFASYTLGIKRLFILIVELGVLFAALFFKDKTTRVLGILGLFNFLASMIVFNPYMSRGFSQITIYSLVVTIFIFKQFQGHELKLRVFQLIIFGFLLNNLAGDFYILLNNKNNTSYKKISDTISENIRNEEQKNIISLIHFWYPLKKHNFYTSWTYWRYKDFESIDELLEKEKIDYVILSPYEIKGKTGTSGREEVVLPRIKYFYDKMFAFVSEHGELIDEIETEQYQNIKIWKIK